MCSIVEGQDGSLCATGRERAEGCEGESIGDMLDLARSLASRLAHAAHHLGAAESIRLARALSLNVVDLLEDHSSRLG